MSIPFGKRSWLLATAALPLLLGGCGGGPSPGGETVESSQPRLDGTTVPMADVTTQAQNNATFAFDLYGQLDGAKGNLFFSPYSVSSALAMTWAGAAGDTATGIATALDFTLPPAEAHAAFDALDQVFATRAKIGTSASGSGPFALNVANALWAQKGLLLETPFLDTLAEDYGSGVHVENFATASDPSRLDINAWVSRHTNGKIPMLLGPGTITAQTFFVITNAVYFSGAWAQPFKTADTAAGTFHSLDGTTSSVQLMHGGGIGGYAQGTGWQAFELPYSNPNLTLTVVLPDDGQFETVEAGLTSAFFNAAVAAEAYKEIVLTLPKFSATTQASLKDALTALGMGTAFGAQADFSGIDGAHDIQLGDVIHQATVTVDEAGTEAAAATAVIGVGSAAPPTVTVTVDRPFFIVLRDIPTGSILFLGRITQL